MGRNDFKQRVIFDVDDKASGDLDAISSSFKGIIGLAGGFAAAGVAGKAISEFVELLGRAADAAAIQEQAEVARASALRRAGPDAAAFTAALDDQAEALQKLGVGTDEAVIKVQALLADMKVAPDQIDEATKAAANLSAALGIDLESAARNVGRTVSGFAGELGELVPELALLGKEALAAGAGIGLLNERFEGAAADRADTYAASMNRLNAALQTSLEVLGEGQTSAGVTFAIQGLSGAIEDANAQAQGSPLLDFLGTLKQNAISASAVLIDLSANVLFAGEKIEASAGSSREAAAAQAELAEQMAAASAAARDQAEAQALLDETNKDFLKSVKKLGVTLDSELNGQLERNNTLLLEADLKYRSLDLSLRDYNAIQTAVAAANERINGTLTGQTSSLSELRAGYDSAGASADIFTDSVDRSRSSLEGAAAAARSFNAETGNALGIRSRTSANQSAVDASLAQGIRPTSGGRRIRTLDGGSVLLEVS